MIIKRFLLMKAILNKSLQPSQIIQEQPLPIGTEWRTKKGKHIPIMPFSSKSKKLTSLKVIDKGNIFSFKHEGEQKIYNYGDVVELPAEMVKPEIKGGKSLNPRQSFDDTDLRELGQSIKELGQLQPITVRPFRDASGNISHFEIIAGERRTRACKLMGIKNIKAIVYSREKVNDKQAHLMRIMENENRKDVSAIEKAEAIDRAIKEGFTYEELASAFQKSTSWIKLMQSLMSLPQYMRKWFGSGKEQYPIVIAYEIARFTESNPAGVQKAFDVMMKQSIATNTNDLMAMVRAELLKAPEQMDLFGTLFDPEGNRREAEKEYFGIKKKHEKQAKSFYDKVKKAQALIGDFWGDEKSLREIAIANPDKIEEALTRLSDMQKWLRMAEKQFREADAEIKSFRVQWKGKKISEKMKERISA